MNSCTVTTRKLNVLEEFHAPAALRIALLLANVAPHTESGTFSCAHNRVVTEIVWVTLKTAVELVLETETAKIDDLVWTYVPASKQGITWKKAATCRHRLK